MSLFLLRHARAGLPALALAVGLGLGTAGATIVQGALLAQIVAGVFTGGAGVGRLAGSFALMLGAILLRAGLTWGREAAALGAAARVKLELRQRLFRSLLRLGPGYARGERTGELVTTATEGIERLEPYISGYLPRLALTVCVPLLIALAVLRVDWISCLILLGTAPFIPLLMVLIGGYAEGQARRQWQTLSRLAAAFLDTVQGVTTVLAFGQEEAKRAQLAARGERFRETTLRVLKLASLSGTVLELMSSLAIGVMAVALAIRLLDGGISFAHAILVFFLTPEFYRPLRELGAHYHAGMEGAVSGRRVVEVLEAPASTSVSPEVRTAPQPPFQIVLSHVSFCYPGSGGPALIDLHLTLEPGGMTAVVGRSGAGKSTLVSLLLRWIDPTDGAITVNGVPLTALSPADWRRCVSLVSQRPYLFSGSILDNIRLGNPHASRDEMRRSARLAGIDQFVAELPAGYDTPVGERGARLSAGQAQRVSLARAFLKDAPVLVLDEPTSFLDPASEAVIRDAVRSLASGRTALVVAHRLSTAAAADRVVVLDAGRVAEVGEPRELLSRGGPFAELATASRPAPQLTPVAGYGVGE